MIPVPSGVRACGGACIAARAVRCWSRRFKRRKTAVGTAPERGGCSASLPSAANLFVSQRCLGNMRRKGPAQNPRTEPGRFLRMM